MRRLVTSIAVLGLGALALAPGSASASEWGTLAPEQQRAIVDGLYLTTGRDAPYAAEEEAGQALADHLAAVGEGAADVATLAEQELSGLQAVDLLPATEELAPSLVGIGPAAGVLGALVGLNYAGHQMFLKIVAPDVDLATGSFQYGGADWWAGDTDIYFGATVPSSGAYLFEGSYDGDGYDPVRWFDQPCPFSGFTPPPGARMMTSQATSATCVYSIALPPYLVEAPVYVDYPYLLKEDVKPATTPHPYDPAHDDPPTIWNGLPSPPDESAVSAQLATALESRDCLRQEAIWQTTESHQPEEEPLASDAACTAPPERDSCHGSGGHDPGINPPGYVSADGPPEQILRSTFTAGWVPSGQSHSVKLYWGSEGQGERHIRIKHPWEAADQAHTAAALSTDPAPIQDLRFGNDDTWIYFYDFELPDGTPCQQRVAVSTRTSTLYDTPRVMTSFAEPRITPAQRLVKFGGTP